MTHDSGAWQSEAEQCRDAGERSSLMHKHGVEDSSIATHRGVSGKSDVGVPTPSLDDQDQYGTLRDHGGDGHDEATRACGEQEPRRRPKNINMEAAELHAMTDLVGAIIAREPCR